MTNTLSVPETDWMADVAHEKDYESEDLDFQAESFETQHFRKKGPIWMWLGVFLLPGGFFACEFFYQGWSDEDIYRYQKAPPLMYPDEDDTPDPEDYLVFRTPEYNDWWDAGLLKRPYFFILLKIFHHPGRQEDLLQARRCQPTSRNPRTRMINFVNQHYPY
jgi:hypothetical protein